MAKKEEKRQIVSHDAERLNNILIENFVHLQKAVTNLSVRFDSLSDQISKLLNLFEISAKSFAERTPNFAAGGDLEKDKEFLDKLNRLLDQNKVIAKGLTLMEEKLKERVYGSQPISQPVFQRPQFNPAPAPSNMPRNFIPSTREIPEEQNA